MKIKQRHIRQKIEDFQHFSEQLSTLTASAQALLVNLKEINPFDEKLFQTEKKLLSCKSKANEFSDQAIQIVQHIDDKYLATQEFIPVDLEEQRKALEALLASITDTMEEYNCKYRKAKEVRTDYFVVYDKIKTWIENAELTISNHNIDPSELKTKLVQLIHDCKDVRLAFEQLVYSGSEIIKNSLDSNDQRAMQADVDQISFELTKTIQLVEDKNQTVDQILGNWANFMRVYQLVVDWSIKLRTLMDRKLQLNSLQEAQLARQDYAVSCVHAS